MMISPALVSVYPRYNQPSAVGVYAFPLIDLLNGGKGKFPEKEGENWEAQKVSTTFAQLKR